MLTFSSKLNPIQLKNIGDIRLALLGFAIPVSVALQNISAFGGGSLILAFAIWNKQQPSAILIGLVAGLTGIFGNKRTEI